MAAVRLIAVVIFAALAAAPARGQTTPLGQPPAPATVIPPDRTAPANPAIRGGDVDPEGPAPGANSFTEAQVRERLVDRGYTQISPLTLDADGIWRGRAVRAGRDHGIAVDYRGLVFAR